MIENGSSLHRLTSNSWWPCVYRLQRMLEHKGGLEEGDALFVVMSKHEGTYEMRVAEGTRLA